MKKKLNTTKQKELADLNIVIPLSGSGTSFINAGYTFPKPLIDINGKPMIQLVIENLKPKCKHKFILIGKKEHFEKYSLNQIFDNSTKGNYQVIPLSASTQGAACTVLSAIDQINNELELIVANGDQIIEVDIEKFISFARRSKKDGVILTFNSQHPRWSYARTNKKGEVLETAEKKVISNHATAGIYYFRQGKLFVEAAISMISKDIRFNNDFYFCPVYNEMILLGQKVIIWEIKQSQMHGLGTPEDLNRYLSILDKGTFSANKHSLSTNKHSLSTNKHSLSTNKGTFSMNKPSFSANKHSFSMNRKNK